MARAVFILRTGVLGVAISVLGLLSTPIAYAAEGNFALQVSPSPLVETVKPGEKKELELKIRNASTADESLKIEARSIRFDSVSGTVLMNDTTPPSIADWLTLPTPGFTVKAGQWLTQKVTVDLPEQSGFSYSLALVISRNTSETTIQNGQLLKGSVAVFTLLNVDREGATRSVELGDITTDQSVYEFLPSRINVRLKNTGNTIVQPYGNVFFQRAGDNDRPITTMPLNDSNAYILPDTERSLKSVWSDGFPLYKQSTDATGATKTTLEWNVEQLRHFRFGQYSARVVAVYNDGTRDIPIIGEVTFWVIPWKTILILLTVIVGVVLLFRSYIKKRTERAVKKALEEQQKKEQS